MEQTARRAGSGGPAFVRLLARLTATDVSESGQSLADRLSLWLTWTDAIALSAVTGPGQPVVKAGAGEDDDPAREYTRLRTDLSDAIRHDGVLAPSSRPAASPRARAVAMAATSADAEPDYAVYRQRYQALQQTMETGIGNLRGRLRGMLAARTPEHARLALVDAIMERSLGARERVLLSSVPRLLEKHFDQLRQAAQAETDAAPATDAAPCAKTPAWLEMFRTHMQQVLLAELDVRLQPIEGVLAALQDR